MIFFTLLLLFLLAARIFGQENQARKIFEQGWVSYRGSKTLHEREMIAMAIIKVNDPHKDWCGIEEVKNLFEKGQWNKLDRVITKKEMTRYLKYDPSLKDKMYILFNSPPRERHTQFVVLRYPPGKADDMWMYSPALTGDRKIKLLSTALQDDPFMGSTFDYENIRRLMGEMGQTADQFTFSLAKEEVIDGRPCYVIEVRPDQAKKPDTGYGLRKFYREKARPVFIRVEYFNKNGRLIKIQNNSAISYINGLWRPALVEMYNANDETTTVLYWTDRKVGLDENNEKEVPFGIFTTTYMERHGR
ncbi:MAG: outer membrane lipoprotein-sorting protein [Parcubacteria group bacterium]|nr:outer membrane lipoprotein-sorting protein [Parcubacteria group bacterium]